MSAGRAAIEAELAAVGAAPEDRIDIARAGLALAALDRPGTDRARYLAHLDELAHDVAALKPEGWTAAAAALARTLAEKHGYRGDEATYDDMQNADLMRVIDRRKGACRWRSASSTCMPAGRRAGVSSGWPSPGIS
jgi:regulator of sirC expression with transglutaminase-like and TPR domain